MSLPNELMSVGLLGKGATGYSISRSLRFNSTDSAYLSRTPGSAGNRKTWTWAGWVKKCSNATSGQYIFTTSNDGRNAAAYIYFSDNYLRYWDRRSSDDGLILTTNAVFRDNSAWFHIVLAVDYQNATSSNRARFFVNGIEQTYSSSSYPGTGEDSYVNAATAHYIAAPTQYFNGYLADIHFIDGQALTPSSFGEFDATTGVWNPKAFSGGSYGTNGFHLDFADNSAATAAALGKDTAGSNNWTPNNFVGTATGTIYSSTWTYSGTGSPTGVQDPTGAFLSISPSIADNSQASGRNAYVNHNGGISFLQFNPSSAISGSSLRVFTYQPQGTSGANTWVNINGGSNLAPWRVSANYNGWSNAISIPGGSLTSLRVSLSYGGGSVVPIYAIEIDGTILRETFGADIDSLVDTPTNGTASSGGDAGGTVVGNYATWNPLAKSSATFSNGNLDASNSDGTTQVVSSSIVPSSKCYWEVTVKTVRTGSIGGIHGVNAQGARPDGSGGAGIYLAPSGSGGGTYVNGTQSAADYSATAGDVIGFAFDPSTRDLIITRNGSSVGTLTAPVTNNLQPVSALNQDVSIHVNFGQRPFAYAAPAGFKSLNTANLPTPTILNGSSYFDTKLYTGNGGSQSISGLAFSPDFVWFKARSTGGTGYNNIVFDVVRGSSKSLATDATYSEYTGTDLTSFNSDGFTLAAPNQWYGVNSNSVTYVAWAWDAGTSTASNTSGSITSTVRANASAGFSVVTYTGTGANDTIGHGLGVAPQMIITKNRSSGAFNWGVYHASAGNSVYGKLNLTDAFSSLAIWQNTTPSSTVFYVGNYNAANQGPDNYVAYCFAPVSGYSNGFSYTGNGSADGSFVYLGFRPRFILIKRTDTTGQWALIDSARGTYNVNDPWLVANLSNAEDTGAAVDLLSNGFKLRLTSANFNASGGTYIGYAFAENPFSIARAR